LAANLTTIVALAAHRTFADPTFLGPVDSLASYLFVSYFLLLAAYLVAHQTVAQGPGQPPDRAGVPPATQPSTPPGSGA